MADSPTRRDFLKTGAAAAALPLATSRALGAGERIGLGVIGCGGRGTSVAKTFAKMPEIDVRCVCDVFDERRDRARRELNELACQTGDHRELLDEPGIDAVLIATPDHWHAQIAIDALAAGKHVYVEKPLSYSIEEGMEVVKAARNAGRVCQVGMQQRSGRHYKQVKAEIVDTGRLGKITLVRTWWHGNVFHLSKPPRDAKPEGLDWNRFVGPRPWREWNAHQFYGFRAFLDFGGGQITDLFTHWIDVVHWYMGEDRPLAAVASGGVYHYKDGRNAPDTICVLNEYPGGWTCTFEATLAPGRGSGYGIEFVGTEGSLLLDGRTKWSFKPVSGDPIEGKAEGDLTEDHVRDFLDCCKSGATPAGDVLIGHRSAMASHLGNIAYLQKRRVELDPLEDRIKLD